MIKKKTQINFKNLKFYYGIPHAHCGFSTGRGTPTEAFDYARHNGLDFLILTDHNNYLIKSVRMNGNELSKWEALKYLRTKYRKKHDNFLPVIGFESKTSGFGDINIINSNRFFTGIVSNLKLLILWMFNNPNAFITLNHPHKNINYLEYSPLLNKLITSIEVGNGSAPNKYSRYDKYYYNLLDKGWQLGAINSQDNHRMNFGDDENLTCIISNELTLDSLITAFRSRHTYSTESKSLVMYFTINNAFMGETIPLDDNELEFYIFIQDNNYKIKEIDIISFSGTVIKKIPDLNLNRIKYIYRHKAETNEKWYVIKTILENGKIGISSPIFRV
ncbi:histidinol phosphatase [Clostridium botulinum]|uniref:histidinol phosphatase n=1 Tax=Clostridium botulinum TaxID=1491 RepID=UPI0013F061A6|nr:histidinol phosphatase [Clostridium botulinum]NFG24928.1 histidinol phosphatase [Clostridium botulinum]NFO03343.1 histidinol phosphatase [Clostridium botulinum]NFR14319.1 histidinol phosphatase [Clostridium botulinum]NFR42396.1 histidinol phosphatase [Clostridium botulinum]